MKISKYTMLAIALVFALLLSAKPANAQVDFVFTNTCLGGPVFFSAQVPDPLQITIWYWQFGDGITSSLQNPIHTYAQAGNYEVILSVTNIYNVTTSVTHWVNMNPLPTAYFQYTIPTCSNQAVQFTDLSSSMYGYIEQWTWHFGDGTPDEVIVFPNDPNVSHLFPQAGTFTLTLTVQNSDLCASSIAGPVTAAPAPIANFNYSGQCAANAVQFTDASYSNNGGNIISWAWDFGDPPSGMNDLSTLSNPMHTYANAGAYNVREIVTNFNGCSDTIIYVVTVFPTLTVNFNAMGLCSGGITVFVVDTEVTDIGAVAAWNWNFGDGSVSTLMEPQHTYASPGSYVVTLTITDTLGCTSAVNHSLTIVPPPVAAYTYTPNVCAGSPVQFTDQSTTPSGFMAKWDWDFGDGSTQFIDYPGNPDVSHTYSNPGTYTVTLTVTNSDSCWDSYAQQVQIFATPVANFSYATGCSGVAIQFTDLSQTNGGSAINFWGWNFDDPGSGAANTSNLQNPVHNYVLAGAYTVMLIVTNSNGCSDTLISPVIIAESPQADFTFTEPQLNEVVQFIDESIAGGSSIEWDWNFGDGNASVLQNPTHTYTLPGYYTVTLQVSDAAGCSNTSDSVLYVSAGANSNTLNGSVYAGIETVSDVTVELVQVDNMGYPLAMKDTVPGANNTFVFENVPEGNYYLRAILNENSVYAAFYMPAYFENDVFWEDATIISLGMAQNPYAIHLASYLNATGGTFVINGQLVNGDKTLNIAGQEIVLLDEQNMAVKWTLTGVDGYFGFSDLQAGTYGVNPVITGLTTYPNFVVLNENTSPVFVKMVVSGQTITGNAELIAKQMGCRVFPNPANETLTITSGEMIERINFYNSQGNSLLEVLKPGMLYQCDISQFASGIYFVKVLTSVKETVVKVIVMH